MTSNLTWGGSELLWAQGAMALAERGHRVKAYVAWSPGSRARRQVLREARVRTVSLALPFVSPKLFGQMAGQLPAIGRVYQACRLWLGLVLRRKPDLVLISQGGNFDGVILATICRLFKLRCLIVSHKANDLNWPEDTIRPYVRRMFEKAPWSFFVSNSNHTLTEQQLGMSIPNWSVIRNPFSVPWNAPSEWPSGETMRLACVGRLDVRDKGQDVLVRVLALPKWRARDLSVTIFGAGSQGKALRDLAAALELSSVRFAGVTNDPVAIWAEHHGLILPSRAEGLPLTIVEAMLSDRLVITTDVGGNTEIVEDDRTGFIAPVATVEMLDEAMERAWARRAEWQAIGVASGAAARATLEEHPAEIFADKLLHFAEQAKSGS